MMIPKFSTLSNLKDAVVIAGDVEGKRWISFGRMITFFILHVLI